MIDDEKNRKPGQNRKKYAFTMNFNADTHSHTPNHQYRFKYKKAHTNQSTSI